MLHQGCELQWEPHTFISGWGKKGEAEREGKGKDLSWLRSWLTEWATEETDTPIFLSTRTDCSPEENLRTFAAA